MIAHRLTSSMNCLHIAERMTKSQRAFTPCEKLDHVKACRDSYGGSASAYLRALETDAACGRFKGAMPSKRNMRAWLDKRVGIQQNQNVKGTCCLHALARMHIIASPLAVHFTEIIYSLTWVVLTVDV